ncbi:MAG: hypothetical protein IPM47_04590 [Sphingobacteriales bacterium]|nr:MAG: hypothetical protein IPM47_04590 [Sphingobacteriales bacterium]
MKIRYSAVRHKISVDNVVCVSVLFHTEQNYSSPIFSTHIKALTGWISNKVNRIGNIVNRAVRHNISVEKKQRFMLSRPGQNMEYVFGSTNIETLTG